MTEDVTPAAVLAERLGFQRASLGPPIGVLPGREAWRNFAGVATPERLQQAHAALIAMPDNPPEPLSPRLD